MSTRYYIRTADDNETYQFGSAVQPVYAPGGQVPICRMSCGYVPSINPNDVFDDMDSLAAFLAENGEHWEIVDEYDQRCTMDEFRAAYDRHTEIMQNRQYEGEKR